MWRGGTLLVVVVVAAIALAAGIDALRGGSDLEPAADAEPRPPPTSTSTVADSPFLEERFEGVLFYTDTGCELQAIELSGRTPVEAPSWDECRFVLSPDATSVSGGGTAWDSSGDHLFHARDGRIVVLSSDNEPEGETFSGTAAAWRPDGTLTYYSDGAVRAWPTADALLSRREIVRGLRAWLYHVSAVQVKEAAWMTVDRLALIVALERPGEPDHDVVTFFDGHRVVGVGSGASQNLSDLRTSPQGNVVAVQSPPSFELLLPDGRRAGVPPLVGVRAIAFSADERWTAAATDAGIYVFRPGSQEWTARLDLDANDLAWRGPAGPPSSQKAEATEE
jgi:hypothetical protein